MRRWLTVTALAGAICFAHDKAENGRYFLPIDDVKGWPKTTPDLTPSAKLWTRWGEEALVKFPVTCFNPKDNPPDPLMAAYKLKQADAKTSVAFLKSPQ